MDLGVIYADHVNHYCVDDEDDHRILVTKCGLRIDYVPPRNRQHSPHGDEHVTCFECLTLDANINPRQRYSLKSVAAQVFHWPTANQSLGVPYHCSVPMCGESDVCEECRKRGVR